MQLNELFNTPKVQGELKMHSKLDFEMLYKIDGSKIVVSATATDFDGDNLIWDVYFSKDDSYDLTNDDKQFETFPVVLDALKRFEKDYTPDFVAFSSQGEKRTAVYNAIRRRIFRDYKQFNITVGKKTHIMLTKKDFIPYEHVGDTVEVTIGDSEIVTYALGHDEDSLILTSNKYGPTVIDEFQDMLVPAFTSLLKDTTEPILVDFGSEYIDELMNRVGFKQGDDDYYHKK